MRVYFNYEDKEYSSEEEIQEFTSEILYLFFQNNRLKIIQSLLPLESEIDEYHDGVVVFDDKNQISMRGLPEELSDRMFGLIKASFGSK